MAAVNFPRLRAGTGSKWWNHDLKVVIIDIMDTARVRGLCAFLKTDGSLLGTNLWYHGRKSSCSGSNSSCGLRLVAERV